MQAISSPNDDESLMGNVVGDIQQMLTGLNWGGGGEQSGSRVSSIC